MDKDKLLAKQQILNSINGFIDLKASPDPGLRFVEDEFAAGSYCDTLYEEVYQANVRICQKLGVQEDKDVELIISNLLKISEHVALKMYDYGKQLCK